MFNAIVYRQISASVAAERVSFELMLHISYCHLLTAVT